MTLSLAAAAIQLGTGRFCQQIAKKKKFYEIFFTLYYSKLENVATFFTRFFTNKKIKFFAKSFVANQKE